MIADRFNLEHRRVNTRQRILSPSTKWRPPAKLLSGYSGRRYGSAFGLEQLRCGFDHPLAMLEQPIAVPADKIDLMLTALLTHRPQVFHRMRSGHLRNKLGEQMRFGLRPIEKLTAC